MAALTSSLWSTAPRPPAPSPREEAAERQGSETSEGEEAAAPERGRDRERGRTEREGSPEPEILHSNVTGTAMSLTSSAAAVKGRHAFQHQESHRALGDLASPKEEEAPGNANSGASGSTGQGGVAGTSTTTLVRVDSKERWQLEGMYGTSRPVQYHRPPAWLVPNQAMLSGIAYCLSSCSMILLNKLVLSGYKWEAQITLMLYQNLVSVTIVLFLSAFGYIQVEPLTPRLILVWLPVNVIFVGMLVTSFFSLQYMQVAMVTILKNVTNLITAVGEMYLFRKRHTLRVWGSLFLMIISAVCGGITDLSFHPLGYTWQGFNCLFTAAYSLTLRRVMDTAKAATRSGTISEFSMVLLNNALSFPPAIIMILAFGEYDFILKSPLMLDRGFWLICTASGLLGLAISFTSMWFLHQTSPTTYSLVGSLNKIPLSILGIIMFNAPTSVANVSSILFGCFAGVVFARAKMSS